MIGYPNPHAPSRMVVPLHPSPEQIVREYLTTWGSLYSSGPNSYRSSPVVRRHPPYRSSASALKARASFDEDRRGAGRKERTQHAVPPFILGLHPGHC